MQIPLGESLGLPPTLYSIPIEVRGDTKTYFFRDGRLTSEIRPWKAVPLRLWRDGEYFQSSSGLGCSRCLSRERFIREEDGATVVRCGQCLRTLFVGGEPCLKEPE